MNEYEKDFLDSVRDKKRTARSARARASRKKGHKGGVKFPYDYLSNKEKKKLIGKVVIYNMYDKILTREEFNRLGWEGKLQQLDHWKQLHGYKVVGEAWGITSTAVASLRGFVMTKLGLKPPRKRQAPRKNKKQTEVTAPVTEEVIETTPVPVKGFNVSLIGEYTGQQIQERILNMAGLLGSDTTYKLTFTISGE